MIVVKLDTRRITSWNTFHEVFAEVFGFPDFYGRNMDAWIDCMTCLDDPAAGMSSVHAVPGGVVTLELEHVNEFMIRCPDQYTAVVECAAFVNWRRIQTGHDPVLALSFFKNG
jgi:hypothetical protein